MQDSDFVSILNKYDIVCLYECWVSKDDVFELENYEQFVFPRSFSKGGGIVLFYKTELRDRLHFIENIYDSIIWFKFDKPNVNESDSFLCFCYIPPEGSVFYEKNDVDMFSVSGRINQSI